MVTKLSYVSAFEDHSSRYEASGEHHLHWVFYMPPPALEAAEERA